jgi:hypothetical protein
MRVLKMLSQSDKSLTLLFETLRERVLKSLMGETTADA